MIKLVFLFFLTLSSALYGQLDTTRFYFNDSTEFIECTYKNGVMHGYCKSYYPNGNLKEYDSVINGKTISREHFSESGENLGYYIDNGRRVKFKRWNENGVITSKGITSWRRTKNRFWTDSGKLYYFHKSRKGYGIQCAAPVDSVIPDSILITNGWCSWNDQPVFWNNGKYVDSNGNTINTKYSYKTLTYHENGLKAQMWKKRRRKKNIYFISWDVNGVLTDQKYL